MRSRAPLAIAAAAVVSLAIPGSASAGLSVTVNDDFFDPTVMPGREGDIVLWSSNGGSTFDEHNVKQDQNLFSSGAPSTSVNFQRTVSAGTFAYYCTEHGGRGGVGMSGKLKMKPTLISPKRRAGAVIGVEWAKSDQTGDQFDVRYRGPGTDGKYKTWLKNTDQGSGMFGANNHPVRVKPDKNYSFQVRSERSDTDKGSEFSPPLKVSTR
jgi:plastocyanin